mmetsp:Transcript_33091/g.104115  ORF Transcript_33091/g.104115 Transcript_33091/m.104115 type:complete len:415 (-) Transcript_33091:1190-2434(-)
MELSLLALSSPPPLAGKTVAVVGGGVGGLVAAGLLARQGAAVTVLEQRPVAGGRLGEHRLGPAGEWRFDSGPSLLLMPEVYRETFELLGDPEPLEMSPVAAPFYHAFFGDDPAGTAPIQLDPARRREEFAAAIERLEGWPGDSMERFDAYMAAATAALDGGWPLAIEERWDVKTVASVLPAFARSALRNFPANLPVGQSHMQQLRRYFPTSDKVRALLSFQDLYVGLSPYEAPAVFSLLQAMEVQSRLISGWSRPILRRLAAAGDGAGRRVVWRSLSAGRVRACEEEASRAVREGRRAGANRRGRHASRGLPGGRGGGRERRCCDGRSDRRRRWLRVELRRRHRAGPQPKLRPRSPAEIAPRIGASPRRGRVGRSQDVLASSPLVPLLAAPAAAGALQQGKRREENRERRERRE